MHGLPDCSHLVLHGVEWRSRFVLRNLEMEGHCVLRRGGSLESKGALSQDAGILRVNSIQRNRWVQAISRSFGISWLVKKSAVWFLLAASKGGADEFEEDSRGRRRCGRLPCI